MFEEYYRGRRVLVTGANGFIGAWLVATLVDLGAEVTGYDLAKEGALSLHAGLRERVGLVLGKTTEQDKLEQALRDCGIQTVFHLAANSNLGWAKSNPVPVFESNIQGAWCVLEACRLAGGLDSIVVASSNTVYGDQPTREPFEESFALNPTHPYPTSKACTDLIARCYAFNSNLPIAIVRATNTFGGADPNLKRIVPNTILLLLDGERPVILSDGTPEKGYLYVKDTVRAYLMVGARAAEDGIRGAAFNFHPPRPTTVLELVQTMVKVSGRTDLEPEVRGRPGAYEYEFLSAKRAHEALGWDEQYTLEEALAETFAWYRDHRDATLEAASDRFVRV
jgi:CDP-glucose 4,6-dehydratase